MGQIKISAVAILACLKMIANAQNISADTLMLAKGILYPDSSFQSMAFVVNVRDHGALGNGSTDDRNAIVSAISYAVRTKRSIVFFPEGTYKCNGSIILGDSHDGDVNLIGSGYKRSVIAFAGTEGPGIRIAMKESSPSVRFAHLEFMGPQALQEPMSYVAGNYGIFVPGSSPDTVINNLLIDHCSFRGWGDNPIRIQGLTGPIVIRDCVLLYAGSYGISIARSPGGGPQDVSIIDGVIQATNGGIQIDRPDGSVSAYDVDVENPVWASNSPLYLKAVYGASFSNCTFSSKSLSISSGIVIDSCIGNTFSAGLVVTYGEVDCVSLMNYSRGNSFVGGYFASIPLPTDPAISGYFARIDQSSTNNIFSQALLSNFSIGRDVILSDGVSAPLEALTVVGNTFQKGTSVIRGSSAPINSELGNFRIENEFDPARKLLFGYDNSIGPYGVGYLMSVKTGLLYVPLLLQPTAGLVGINTTQPDSVLSVGGSASIAHGLRVGRGLTIGSAGAKWLTGEGSPESKVHAPKGSLYLRTDGISDSTMYLKVSGTGSVGWILK